MTAAQASVVNEALEAIAAQTTITDLNDGSVAGNAAAIIYTPTVNMLLRLNEPAFALRMSVALAVISGGHLPPSGGYEYAYPSDCLRLRALRPAAGSFNPLDPRPVLSTVALDIVSGASVKVIYTREPNALATYISSQFTESQWDAVFRQLVVKKLEEPLAMAVAGRPDFAKAVMEEAAGAAQLAALSDENIGRAL